MQLTTLDHLFDAITQSGSKRQRLRTAIIVTELPYQVSKAALLEHIADLVNDKEIGRYC